MNRTLSFILLNFLMISAVGQTDDYTVIQKVVHEGDTMGYVALGEAAVAEYNPNFAYRKSRSYLRTQRRVLKVYPYARTAGQLMEGYDRELAKIKGKKKRKEYLEEAENALKKKFEGEIRNMTVTEGFILIKLIDRETGDSSYELVKELKGSFNAFMWQSLARLFGHNLKNEYEPENADWMIEDIVLRIERGDLQVSKKDGSVHAAKSKKKKRRRKK